MEKIPLSAAIIRVVSPGARVDGKIVPLSVGIILVVSPGSFFVL